MKRIGGQKSNIVKYFKNELYVNCHIKQTHSYFPQKFYQSINWWIIFQTL